MWLTLVALGVCEDGRGNGELSRPAVVEGRRTGESLRGGNQCPSARAAVFWQVLEGSVNDPRRQPRECRGDRARGLQDLLRDR